ncbi:hypothetical protein ANN_17557 [Periplaneta americana]|uniref:Uncharacterized protein n=1 Tax=Periplaneta americana TaxID=6978 RepID=A0ABQ8ST91_PERAM|nr:hypothetical protein ANN_17557 [Periplaneta americana]
MDLREVGYDDRDWINLAQDRDRCEGGNEPSGSLKAISTLATAEVISAWIEPATLGIEGQSYTNSPTRSTSCMFKVCHGSLYAVMWLADEPKEFNLPTLPQRCITYEAEKLPSKYGVHSEDCANYGIIIELRGRLLVKKAL